MAGTVTVALLAVGALATPWQRVLTGAEAPPDVATVEESILLRCLPAGEAAELVRPLLQDRVSTVRLNPNVAPRVLVLRTTPTQLQRARALLAAHEGAGAGACPAPQPATPAP